VLLLSDNNTGRLLRGKSYYFIRKMKKKISISIEENTITELNNRVSEGTFRSKSHVVEFALNKLLKESTKNEKS